MSNLILFVPGDAQRGGSIAVEEFAAAADELLSKALELEPNDALAEQAQSAVEAAKALVDSGHAGDARVVAVISCRIDPSALPLGSGHIVAIELTSRPSPAAAEPEAPEAIAAPGAPAEGEAVGSDGPKASAPAIAAAAALGVDLAGVTGSGKDGAISKGDVEKAAADRDAAAKAALEGKDPAQPVS